MSVERDQFTTAFRRQVELERKAGLRRPFTASRRAESSIDHSQLAIKSVVGLRITEEGNGATAGDIGKMWFVPGYSTVGGPDIVPEE